MSDVQVPAETGGQGHSMLHSRRSVCAHPDHREPTLLNEDDESLLYCQRCTVVVQRCRCGDWFQVGGITKVTMRRG